MVKREDMFLRNYSGTLMYLNKPLCYFKIQNGELVEARRIRKESNLFPYEIWMHGITYGALNEFFRDRVVLDGAQFCREYLSALGLDHYDFEAIVKINHGRNNLDNWWVKDQMQ